MFYVLAFNPETILIYGSCCREMLRLPELENISGQPNGILRSAIGEGSSMKQSKMGRLVHNGEAYEMGFPASVSDVIGCFLQLHKAPNGDSLEGNVMWSHNGQLVTSPHANLVHIPPETANGAAFFPSTLFLFEMALKHRGLNFSDN